MSKKFIIKKCCLLCQYWIPESNGVYGYCDLYNENTKFDKCCENFKLFEQYQNIIEEVE